MNKYQRQQAMEVARKPHFSIRKLNIGAASVLLGTTLYLASSQTQTVKADSIPDDPESTQVDQASTDITTDDQTDTSNSSVQKADTNIIASDQRTNNVNVSQTNQDDVPNVPVATNATTQPTKPVAANTAAETNANDTNSSTVTSITKNGITGEYDKATDTLTLSGIQTLTAKTPLFGFKDEYGLTVKHLKIKDKITCQNDSLSGIFEGLTKLEDIDGLNNLQFSAVSGSYMPTDMSSMFANCSSLKTLDLSSFNTSSVQNMSNMFRNCTALTSLNIDNFDTKSVTLMKGMFENCLALKTLDVSKFNVYKVTDFSYMFHNCMALTNLDVSHFDMNKVDDMSYMFAGCTSLTKLDLTDFAGNISHPDGNIEYIVYTNLNDMLHNCDNLNMLTIGPWLNLKGFNGNYQLGLNNPGLWFRQGDSGSITNPDDQTGKTSDDLASSNDWTLHNYNTQTYLRGYKYQVHYYNKDDDNKELSDVISDYPTSILVLLHEYPAGTDIGHGLTVKEPAEITAAIARFKMKYYKIVNNPFDPSFTPQPEDKDIKLYFAHETKDEVETEKHKLVVHYQDDNGKTLKDDINQDITFTRTKTTDLVTRKISYSDWALDNGQVNNLKNPVINGYITDKTSIAKSDLVGNKDIELTQIYHKLGQLVPVDTNGKAIANAKPLTYKNDLDNPTKILTEQPVPSITGYEPLTPVVTPDDPTKDTNVSYRVKNETIIGFLDQDNQNQAIHEVINTSSIVGDKIAKPENLEQILLDLANHGYELVTDPFKEPVTAIGGKQELNYIFKHKKDNQQKETITRKHTIHFIDSQGNKLAADKVTEVSFTRMGTKDLVTNTIDWNPWSPEQTLADVPVPVIKGYITAKAKVTNQTITADKDVEVKVAYQKLGSYVPVDSKGQVISGVNKVIYENDPTDPTKIKTNQSLPTIQGYVTPQAPMPNNVTQDTLVTYTATTTTPVNPVNPTDPNKPVNPTDPNKPINPTDPNKPVNPTDPNKPVNPTDPSKPVNPTDSSKPVNPTDSNQTTNPIDPSKPVNPINPSKPVNPTDSTKPIDPTDSNQTTNPIDPIAIAHPEMPTTKPSDNLTASKQTSSKQPEQLAHTVPINTAVNTNSAETGKANHANQSLGMSKTQMATLPQTGTKTNNREALSVIALGFSLISLSLAAKPKKKYC